MTVRLLPLFPLPLVLFPGASLPLHIFELRYRTLLSDALAGDRSFGIILRADAVPEHEISSGTVGCIAHVESAEPLPDGRSNVVVSGRERFSLERFVAAPAPYSVAEIATVDDEEESALVLEPLAARARTLFERVGRSARAISDDASPLPALPGDAAALSFAMAQHINLDLDVRQRLLSSRSPAERLRQLIEVVTSAEDDIERRSRAHGRARTNGDGPHQSGVS